MIKLDYNAQLNTKATVLKFYTPWEFFTGIILSFILVAIPMMINLPPSIIDPVAMFVAYTLFLIYFKIGKPEGYLAHLLSHLLTPLVFRPGHKCPAYPVKPLPEEHLSRVARTHEQLWQACREKQQQLLEVGLVPNGNFGGYLKLEDPDYLAASRAYVSAGGVLTIGTSVTDGRKD